LAEPQVKARSRIVQRIQTMPPLRDMSTCQYRDVDVVVVAAGDAIRVVGVVL